MVVTNKINDQLSLSLNFSLEMSADDEIDHLVRSLELIPHPEGGFFGEQYRTDRQVTFIQPNKFVYIISENYTLSLLEVLFLCNHSSIPSPLFAF